MGRGRGAGRSLHVHGLDAWRNYAARRDGVELFRLVHRLAKEAEGRRARRELPDASGGVRGYAAVSANARTILVIMICFATTTSVSPSGAHRAGCESLSQFSRHRAEALERRREASGRLRKDGRC